VILNDRFSNLISVINVVKICAMSSEPIFRLHESKNKDKKPSIETVDLQDLAYAGGFVGDAREIVESLR
jgi:hypothetical protein